ncbi:hypothetical protein [Sinomonas atrocyanea]
MGAAAVRHGREHRRARRRDQGRGRAGIRDQKENALRNRRRLNQLLDDVELPSARRDFERKPLNENAVRDIFARLQFKSRCSTADEDRGRRGMLDGASAFAQVGDAER